MVNLTRNRRRQSDSFSVDEATLPRPFPLVRYYLLASVLLVVAAFSVLNFSTQRIQSGTAINSLRQEAISDVERVAFDLSLAVTSLVNPGDDLATSIQGRKTEFDRAVINSLSGFPIVRVDLLTPSGALAYSTDPQATLAITDSVTRTVIAGETYSRYDDSYSLRLFNGRPSTIAAIVTANPLHTEWSVDGTGPVAVLVAFRDVTHSLPGVTSSVAPERIAVLGGTLAGLFILLSWIVIRGHRFTVAAREKLAAMLVTEREIRQELDIRNDELVEANEAKSRFLATITHELKTPLTSINAFSSILEKSLGDQLTDRQARQFDALSRNGKRLNALIEELLDVSAAASGKLTLGIETVTAAQIETEAVQLTRALFEDRGQELRVEVPEPDLQFPADPNRIQQVVINLLSNASKYSPEGSQVNFSIAAVDDHIRIEVTDSGMGMSDEDLAQLFSTFFRSEQAIASGVEGTGLGMVIVKSIVEGHGGLIKVKSKVGAGTTVCVQLPATRQVGSLVDDSVQDAA